MGSISAAIELHDHFTGVLMNVISAVTMSVSAMEQMQSTMSDSMDTTSIQGIRDQLTQATVAAQELDAAMQNITPPAATRCVPVKTNSRASSSVPVQNQLPAAFAAFTVFPHFPFFLFFPLSVSSSAVIFHLSSPFTQYLPESAAIPGRNGYQRTPANTA